ncbi:MAG: tetratricopeptide repeat protein [Verrucomicrobia bacterium]|nr:tetratricopeptide repeat protein [Verrucomicrobiota bacterium]
MSQPKSKPAKPGAPAAASPVVALSGARPMATGQATRQAWLVMAALFFVTLALFWPATRCEFVNYDDPDYVTANDHVRAGLTAESVRWATLNLNISYWHPLTWLSHMFDWQVFGDRPAGHHATNVGWHAINAVLAFLLLRRLTGRLWTSAIVAAVFAWHPLRVESVAWVSERKDVLSGFFWLLTLWAYAGYAEAQRDQKGGAAWRYVAALAAFAAGLASKPMVVTLPVVLLVIDFWPWRRHEREAWWRLLVEKIPFGVLSLAVSIVTIVAQKGVGTLSTVLAWDARLANGAVAVARYFGKFFAPFNLAVLYPHPGYWPGAAVAASVVFIAGLSWLAWTQRARRPWIAAGWLWFLVALLPASGVVAQVGIQSMADRYTYLPMLGVTIAVAWTIADAVHGPGARRAWAWAAAAVLLAGAARTWDQQRHWRNSLALFDHVVAVAGKENYLAYNNRGMAVAQAGRLDDAERDYRKSLEIAPAYPNANNNLGHLLEQRGRPVEAIPFYRAAIAAKPDLLEAHNNLGNALSDVGQPDEALKEYAFVLERQPRHVNSLVGSGVALAMKGAAAEAQARFESALRIDPHSASALCNLGILCAMSGRRDEAAGYFGRALAVSPDDARTLYNFGNVLTELGRYEEAAQRLRRAVELSPINPDALAALGNALARLGRRAEAIAALRTALQQRPDFPQARTQLGQLEAGK